MAKKENESIDRIKAVIREKMINPFKSRNAIDLLNISTDKKAASLDLITVREKGIQILQKTQESAGAKVPSVQIKTFKDKKKRAQTLSNYQKKNQKI